MRIAVYGVVIAAALMIPTKPLELGKLKPVEVIQIDQQGDLIQIKTDTGDLGQGKTVELAIRDLQETTAGMVYLDTAEYVLLPKDESVVGQVSPYLKNGVRLCQWEGEMKLDEVAVYLDAHSPKIKLEAYRLGMQLEVLTEENGRIRLQEKISKKV